jgi:hypothetical protein
MPILKISKQQGLAAIFNALTWLSQNGLADHVVERLNEYPIFTLNSSRDVLSTLSLLGIVAISGDQTKPTFLEKYQSPGNPTFMDTFPKHQAIAFTYSDPASTYQELTVTKLYTEKFGSSKNLRIVTSNKSRDKTGTSIAENITNLIAGKYFASKGYMVREDRGQGPDLIAFKTDLVADMVKRGVVRSGATVSEIGAARVFGRVQSENIEANIPDEIICVETESTQLREGIKQLTRGYGDSAGEFSSVDFFDRRVLAVPFLNEPINDLDVLTYDSGFQFIPAKTNQLSESKRLRKNEFIEKYLESIIMKMLLSNLTLDELMDLMIPRPKSLFQFLQGIEKINAQDALNAVDNVLRSKTN